MKPGYVRVSTSEQVLTLQLDALYQAGYQQAFIDMVSVLQAYPRPGDTVIIRRLDRLNRSTKRLIEVLECLSYQQLHRLFLRNFSYTSSPGGQPIFQLVCTLAGHKRSVFVPRTHAGLHTIRTRGWTAAYPGLASLYQQNTPTVKQFHKSRQRSTCQLMSYFQIGSWRILSKIMRCAGCQIATPRATGIAQPAPAYA